jgi:hypothetical protein
MQPNQQNRGKSVAIAIATAAAGLLMVGVGCIAVLYVYAFASIVPPDLPDWDRTLLILQKMLLSPSVVLVLFGVVGVALGVRFVYVSFRIALGLTQPSQVNIRRIAVHAAIFLLLAILFAILG